MAFGSLKGTFTGTNVSIQASNPVSTITQGSGAVNVGDLAFVVSGQQTNLTTSGVTDNLGNTYTALNAGTDAGAITGRAYYSRITVAGTITSFTVAATGSSNDWAAIGVIIEGPFASSPLDANPANSSNDLSTPYPCPATGTLAQADEVVLSWFCYDNLGTLAATAPNTLAGPASVANVRAAIGYQTVSATTTVTPEFNKASGTEPTSDVLGTASFKKDTAQTLTPGLFTNSQTFFAPTVSPGAMDLSPGLITLSQTFFAPTVSPGAVNLSPGLITLSPIFFAPTVSPGAVNLSPGLVTNSQGFFAPSVSPGAVTLTLGLLSSGPSFLSPAATPGAVNLAPATLASGATFLPPGLSPGAVNLSPGLVSFVSVFFAPSAVPGAVNLSPALFVNDQTFFSPVLQYIPILVSTAGLISYPVDPSAYIGYLPGDTSYISRLDEPLELSYSSRIEVTPEGYSSHIEDFNDYSYIAGCQMPKAIPFKPVDSTDQVQTLILDFGIGPYIPQGVTLNGTPTVMIAVYEGTDSSPQSRLIGTPVIGTALAPYGSGRTNCAVVFQIGNNFPGPLVYLVKVKCNKSNGDVATADALLPTRLPGG